MQTNNSTGEVYASCESTAGSEVIDLMTIEPHSHVVVCWDDVGGMRWQKVFGDDLKAAVAEYNRWAKTPERVPTFN